MIKSGFHACVSKPHGGAQCLLIYEHHCSQTIRAFATKACVLTTKSHTMNFPEGLRGLCCDALWLIYENMKAKYKNIFFFSEKRAKPKSNFITTTFRKSLFITQYRMRYAIYIPLNAKDLSIDFARKTTLIFGEH